MAKYRKKPVVVEAIRWTGDNTSEVASFMSGKSVKYGDGVLVIPTLEGDMIAHVGDWIIRGVYGEYYPCKPDVFAMTYEDV